MDDALFPDVAPPEDAPTSGPAEGAPRYQAPNRAQVELYPCDLEALLPPAHAARLVWQFVDGLDLRAFYAAIAARGSRPGRAAIDPRILIALWLYATMDGVGSAREVARLCERHDAYRWLRGGVSVNHHTLSDFRVDHQAALDDLLTQSIAALLHGGVITMARVAHDGTRVRGQAGAGSFRRAATLEQCLHAARQQVARTAKQSDGPAPTRAEAAQRRAATDRLARVEAALAELPAVAAVKARQQKKKGTRGQPAEPRVSTTDPEARVMKMADGGFRPAYNVHLATDAASRAVVGVHTTNDGTDQAHLVPMLEDIARRVGRVPTEYLVDGGFATKAGITASAARGVTVYAPPMQRRGGGTRALAAPCPHDAPAVAAWRARMATDAAKQIYRMRGATAEWLNADMRTHRTLHQFTVRGLQKVHTWVLWVALAHNMLRTMGIVPHRMT